MQQSCDFTDDVWHAVVGELNAVPPLVHEIVGALQKLNAVPDMVWLCRFPLHRMGHGLCLAVLVQKMGFWGLNWIIQA